MRSAAGHMTSRPRPTGRAPLADVGLLLIDGNNLLHRTTGGVEPGAVRSLVTRLRAALPGPLSTIVVLDGHAAAGVSSVERAGRGLEIRRAGAQSADDALVELAKTQPFEQRARTLVVTDDRSLTERVRAIGGRTQRLAWLEGLLARPPGKVVGVGRPYVAAERAADDEERRPWQPGRGATRKTGNPRRAGRHG
jgi:hypothetical protein